ncbi:ABC-ATPase domain-containing protein [Rothia halotolerans]|uniref:ABC-ATPase domain-containing protein n=1 Tax=Rothia halotolerans TaxID=405770 RepID=UPI00101DCB27|nr:ABC-ATPase domain-containing protein [Rothia halotolerans]
MREREQLQQTLNQMDGSGYGAYKRLVGRYDLGACDLVVDHVQSDPYAPPSSIRAVVSLAESSVPAEATATREQRTAVADFLARDLAARLAEASRDLRITRPGQEVLERSSVVIDGDAVEVRMTASLPAAGRRVKGRAAARLLTEELPRLIEDSALLEGMDRERLDEHVRLHLDQLDLYGQLAERGLIAFVGDGAVLPRRSGVSDLPLEGGVAFRSPASLRTKFTLRSGRTVTGMGIPRGVTVIVGGGYHGKSTLLRAVERGVYPHLGGDGREWVLTVPDAVSIRAEDGRAAAGVDISPFISDLPSGADTAAFTTANASGSTSQATNLAEALEAGASALLIDEDTSATNFMIRDRAMRELIPAGSEPITPFVDRVRALFDERGVSTVLVAGGSGAFFPVADHVVAMDTYVPEEVTEHARRIAARHAAQDDAAEAPAAGAFARSGERIPARGCLRSEERKPPRARGRETIQAGKEDIDLAYLPQLVDGAQTAAIALLLERVGASLDGETSLGEAVRRALEALEEEGLDSLTGPRRIRGDLALPRRHEVHAAVSRHRRLRVR